MLVTDSSDTFDVFLTLDSLKQILVREFGLAREDTMRVHHPGYGNEGVDLFWSNPPLYIHIRGKRGGPFRVNPATKDKSTQKRVRKLRDQHSVNSTYILREFVSDHVDRDSVKRLDGLMTFVAFVVGLLPGIASFTLVPHLVSLSYILLWGFLYSIYRFGMYQNSIDIRLFSIATGLFLLCGAVAVLGYGGVVVLIQLAALQTNGVLGNTIYIAALVYLFVFALFTRWLSFQPKRIYTTQWNLLLKADLQLSYFARVFRAEEAASLLIPASGLTALILGLGESVAILITVPDIIGLSSPVLVTVIIFLLVVLLILEIHALRWLTRDAARRLTYWIPDMYPEYPAIVARVGNESRRRAIVKGIH